MEVEKPYNMEYTGHVHKTYKTYLEEKKTRFLSPSLPYTWAHVIYNGAYI